MPSRKPRPADSSDPGREPAPAAPAPADDPPRLSPAMEDYLEAILLLSERSAESGCTVSEIAEALDNAKPSVSKAIKRLREGGYVDHQPYGRVTLTPLGLRVAKEQVRVHRILKHFLEDVLQLPEAVAEADTCRMEHAVSKATVDRLIQFVEQLDANRRPDLPDLPTPAASEDRPRSWTSRV